MDDKPRLHWRDRAREADYLWLREQLPGREIGFGSSTLDERFWIVTARSDVEPGETYLFDAQAKTLRLQYRIREQLPRAALAPMLIRSRAGWYRLSNRTQGIFSNWLDH